MILLKCYTKSSQKYGHQPHSNCWLVMKGAEKLKSVIIKTHFLFKKPNDLKTFSFSCRGTEHCIVGTADPCHLPSAGSVIRKDISSQLSEDYDIQDLSFWDYFPQLHWDFCHFWNIPTGWFSLLTPNHYSKYCVRSCNQHVLWPWDRLVTVFCASWCSSVL